MIFLERLRSILRWIFRRDEAEGRLEAELQAYIDISAAEKIRNGASPEEARRLARMEIGGVEQTKERVRSGRHGGLLDQLFEDIRIGARSLLKTPGFTVVALLTLVLGIGGISAVFSALYGVVLRPLPYNEPDRLVMIWEQQREPGTTNPIAEWRAANNVFEGIALFEESTVTWVQDGEPETIQSLRVSPELFPLLGIQPIRGRTFGPPDIASSPESSAVVSYGFWQRRFGGDAAIIGKTIAFEDRPLKVIGVMPAGFTFPNWGSRPPELWTLFPAPGNAMIRGLSRLKPGVSIDAARTDLERLGARLVPHPPNRGPLTRLVPLDRQFVGATNRQLLWLFFGAVALVLLIAIVNVANLTMARAAGREREIAIRAAVGSTRGRLVRYLLTESLLLGFAGGSLGFLAATWGAKLMASTIPAGFPRIQDIRADGNVLAFTFGTTLLAAVAFGIFPALSASRPGLFIVLKDAPQTSGSFGRARLRRALVAVETGLATVLLIGAGLLCKSFWNIVNFPLGMDTADILVLDVPLPADRYPHAADKQLFYDNLSGRLQAIPGILAVAASNGSPIGSSNELNVVRTGPNGEDKKGAALIYRVTPNFLDAMRIAAKTGRVVFDAGRREAVVASDTAGRYWRDADPVGMEMFVGDPSDDNPRFTIVGVSKQVQGIPAGVREQPAPAVFIASCDGRCSRFFMRIARNPQEIIPPIRATVASLDARLRSVRIQTLDETVRAAHTNPQFRTALLTIFAAVAVVLALVGIYGVTSYLAAQRTKEIGIRVALGATRADVVRMMTWQGLQPLIAGIVTGTAGAAAGSRLLASYLFEVDPLDRIVFIAVPATFAVAAFLANLIPARRSAAMDPMTTLRME